MRVGIIGAGLSGLMCAQRLSELAPSLQVSVLEWGRGPGGRTARRRVTLDNGTELSFDHAAPYFSASTDAFRGILSDWQAAGVVAPWPSAGKDIYVGTPASNSIARHLATTSGASLLFGHHVLAAEHDVDGNLWNVRAKSRATNTVIDLTFDALVMSDKLLILPNKYAVLSPSSELNSTLALPPTLTSTGTIVLLIALQHASSSSSSSSSSLVPYPVNTTIVDEQATTSSIGEQLLHPILSRIIHDSAKPGRTGSTLDQWVVHSTPEYAAQHLVGEAIDDEAAVLTEMQAAFFGQNKQHDIAQYASIMVWDHAQLVHGSQLDEAFQLDSAKRAGICGDFYGAGKGLEGVEAAVLSGSTLGQALAKLLLSNQKSEL